VEVFKTGVITCDGCVAEIEKVIEGRGGIASMEVDMRRLGYRRLRHYGSRGVVFGQPGELMSTSVVSRMIGTTE
jgi:hypothetical protein